MKKILSVLKPWQYIVIVLGLAMCFTYVALDGAFRIVEEVPGLTRAVLEAPDQKIACEAMLGLEKACRGTAIGLEDDGKKPNPKITTAVEASILRARLCRKFLLGTGMCKDGDLEPCADCCTAYLRNRLGSEDFKLDEPSPRNPEITGRQEFILVMNDLAKAAEKLK